MSELDELESFILREYENLNKSKYRPRSLQGILEKRSNLEEGFRNYYKLLKSFEHRIDVEEWNKLVERYEEVKLKYSVGLQILERSQIIVTSKDPDQSDNNDLDKITDKMAPGTSNQVEEKLKFPLKYAIKCIPEFTGSPEELDAFFYQVDRFEELIPEGDLQLPLINVVMMKMRGNAMKFVNRVKSDTWKETKEKILKEFGAKKSIEEIQVKIENLEQGDDETFRDYKERALTLLEDIESLASKDTAYPEKCLKIHFVSGIKNKDLKLSAKREKHREFRDLIQFLEDECMECEQMAAIEKKLKICRLAESKDSKSINKNNLEHENKSRNFQHSTPNHYRRQNFRYNNSNQQRNFSNEDRNFSNRNRDFYSNRNGNYQNNSFGNQSKNFSDRNRNFGNQNQNQYKNRNNPQHNPNFQGYASGPQRNNFEGYYSYGNIDQPNCSNSQRRGNFIQRKN